MIGGLIRFIVLRVFGARVLLVLGILAWVRNRLWPTRRTPPSSPSPSSPTRRGVARKITPSHADGASGRSSH